MKEPDRVMMAHGGGGVLSRRLITELWQAAFGDEALNDLPDAAILEAPAGKAAFTTDAFVVTPLFFPGGDIGRLAVCGTVNDLAVSGATPLWLSLAAVIEEGLPLEELRRIAASAADAAREAHVRIVTGDTKVVERGAADRIYLVTSGVGVVPEGREVGPSRIEPGDAVLVSGTIGDHGIALLARREGLAFQSPVESDCAPLSGLVEALFQSGAAVHAMRDPTRGGLAATLFEIAEASGITIEIEETALPVKPSVRGACEMLGLDPITIANEGKLVGVVADGSAETALRAARGHALGADAAIIGRAVPRRDRPLLMRTRIGGERIVEMPYGEAQPRIC